MIGFTVIGGYLGAGKTTLLNHLLKHNQGQRFALLINDFGAINIDAALITEQTDAQINLANGCVCCTLADGFHAAIEQLEALDPPADHIIVEASGVADVRNLSQYGYGPSRYLAGIIVLADAQDVIHKANDKYVAQTIRRQLKAADLVILNKIDLVDQDTLERTRTWLDQEAGCKAVVMATRSEVPVSLLTNITDQLLEPHIHNGSERHSERKEQTHESHAHYRQWSHSSKKPMSEARFDELKNLLDGPNILRAKGIVTLESGEQIEIQRVGQRLEFLPRDHLAVSEPETQQCQVVAIGLQALWDAQPLKEWGEWGNSGHSEYSEKLQNREDLVDSPAELKTLPNAHSSNGTV